MTAKVILNPYANRWEAGRRQAELEGALRAAGIEYELACSQQPGEVSRLAREAMLAGYSPILAAGGDGTIGETVNGMLSADHGAALPPLGILPMGTANDLAHGLSLPKTLAESARVIAAGKTALMDLGQVNEHYFANNSGLGIEPYITLVQQRIGWIKGVARYLVAALLGILDRPAWQVQMEWDGGSYAGPVSLITIGNGPRSGGFFYMSPNADCFDGKLTVVFGYRRTRRAMLALLPKTFTRGKGSYVGQPGIREIHISWLEVRFANPSPAHVDGEIISEGIKQLSYRIHAQKVPVLLTR